MGDSGPRSAALEEAGWESMYLPHRAEYLLDSSEDDGSDGECVFCDLPDRDSDREALVVARAEHNYAALNLNPYNVGHVLVMPYDHGDNHDEFPPSTVAEHALLVRATISAVTEAFDPDGFNTGTNLGRGSGGSVRGHLHTHVIPRWTDDTDFLLLTAATSTVEGSLMEMYDVVYDGYASLEAASEPADGGAVSVHGLTE